MTGTIGTGRRIFVTGGTGLIGREIVGRLISRGDRAVVLTRDAGKASRAGFGSGVEVVEGDPTIAGGWMEVLGGCDGVVNLAGEPVFSGGASGLFRGRWTSEVKRRIRDSRVEGTRNVAEAVARSGGRCGFLAQASAIGYYGGSRGDEVLTESSAAGEDFLARVCVDWEGAAARALDAGARVVVVRVGVVLARGAGALGVMAPLFRWVPGAAAPVGRSGGGWGWWFLPSDGSPWVSWIHLEDIAGMFVFAMDRGDVSGPLNGTAPHPVRHREFARALARALGRRSLPLGPPPGLLRLLLGEVSEVIAGGARVLPSAAEGAGFRHRHAILEDALGAIFGERG